MRTLSSVFIHLSSSRIRVVTAITGPSDLPRPKTLKQPDARRNLYVLGLPFDLTKCVYFILHMGSH